MTHQNDPIRGYWTWYKATNTSISDLVCMGLKVRWKSAILLVPCCLLFQATNEVGVWFLYCIWLFLKTSHCRFVLILCFDANMLLIFVITSNVICEHIHILNLFSYFPSKSQAKVKDLHSIIGSKWVGHQLYLVKPSK